MGVVPIGAGFHPGFDTIMSDFSATGSLSLLPVNQLPGVSIGGGDQPVPTVSEPLTAPPDVVTYNPTPVVIPTEIVGNAVVYSTDSSLGSSVDAFGSSVSSGWQYIPLQGQLVDTFG